jgi:hypothetical protein
MSMNELEKQLSTLYQEEGDLKSRIMAETHFPTKRQLMEQKAKLYERIQQIERKLDEIKEENAKEELNKLLIEHRYLIFLSVNGRKLEVPENLQVELTFEPCHHKSKIFIGELLRNPQFPSNTNLLDHWQRLLTEDTTITTMRLCEQCRKDRESLKAKLGFWQPERPIGRANIVLRRLQ